jgi:hypothetical protein
LFRFSSQAFAIEKLFFLIAGCIYALESSPVQVRKNVHHGKFRTPVCLIVIETVLRESAEIRYSKVAAAGRRILFTQLFHLSQLPFYGDFIKYVEATNGYKSDWDYVE